VHRRRPSAKLTGVLLAIMLASIPLSVCTGNKPSEQPAPPQPAGDVTADLQPDAVNLGAITPEGKGGAAASKELFQKNCALCHYADQAGKKIGPGLKGVLKNKELPASHKPATEANVRTQIGKGSLAKGMPAFGAQLAKAEIDSLIAYLKTL
jgi:mono/diheme cytochrome c family protein